jgi:hypothetical protein
MADQHSKAQGSRLGEWLLETFDAATSLPEPPRPVSEDHDAGRELDDGGKLSVTNTELAAAMKGVIEVTGGSSGGGRWSAMFGLLLEPRTLLPTEQLGRLSSEARDVLKTAGKGFARSHAMCCEQSPRLAPIQQ